MGSGSCHWGAVVVWCGVVWGGHLCPVERYDCGHGRQAGRQAGSRGVGRVKATKQLPKSYLLQ